MKRKNLVAPICAAALMGAFVLSACSKGTSEVVSLVDDKSDSEPPEDVIDISGEQIDVSEPDDASEPFIDVTGLSADEREVYRSYGLYGMSLTIEQIQKIVRMYDDLNWSYIAGSLLYQGGITLGEVDPDAPKLDLETARKIIAEHNDFDEIISEFNKIQKYPDYVGGSGHDVVIYCPDSCFSWTANTITVFPMEQSIVYSEYGWDFAEILWEPNNDTEIE